MHLNFRNLAAALAGYGGAVYCKGIARPSLPLRQQPSGMSQRQRYGGCGGSNRNISTGSARDAPGCGRIEL